jgi:hypothetical protein
VSDSAPQRSAEPVAEGKSSNNFLVRLPAAVVARNMKRGEFAWAVQQHGASETLPDRWVDEDLGPAVSKLREQAVRGVPSAINTLGWLSGQTCPGLREERIGSYLQYQLTQSEQLPADDGAWFRSLARLTADYDRKLAAVCSQLDPAQIAAWVTRQAARGDPESQFLLARDMGVEIGRSGGLTLFKTPDRAVSNLWLRKAADGGFAQAKYELAWDILNTLMPRITPASYSVLTLLREAAESMPLAEANLAACEYSGCEGTAPDIAAAVIHAREAAIRGQAEAFLQIGPHLGPAYADEVAAWKLIRAALQQDGCGESGVSMRWMKGVTEDISAANALPGGLKLATELWEGHGRQMMSALGCAT